MVFGWRVHLHNCRKLFRGRFRTYAELDVASAIDVINDLGFDALTFLVVTVMVVPAFKVLKASPVKDFHFRRSFFWGGTEIKVWFGKVEGLSVKFLEPQNGMVWAGRIHGWNDGDRFGFFCHAALEFLLQTGVYPDILHCHDSWDEQC